MDSTQLRFGVFIPPQHPLKENPSLLFERDLAVISMCDRLGFEEAWIGEHHSGGYETIASPELVIAVAAERTKTIRLGTGVRSLPYSHPLMVADTIVQLDHMTRGRVTFGVGPGALPMDAMQLGLDPARSREMMVEALEVIIPLLEGETVTAETDWFRLCDARLQIEPLTRPRMEIAVTSVRSPAGAMLAGRFGLGTLSLGGASDDALAKYAEHGRICQETAAKHGRTVHPWQHRIAVPVHIAESREKAIADVGFGFERWADYARDVLPFSPLGTVEKNRLAFVMDTRRAIIGTPDDAIDAIEAIQKGSGGMGAFLIMEQNWADWSEANRSYEMFARYVIPHFRGQFAARQRSYDASREQHGSYVVAARQGVANAEERYREQQAMPSGKTADSATR